MIFALTVEAVKENVCVLPLSRKYSKYKIQMEVSCPEFSFYNEIKTLSPLCLRLFFAIITPLRITRLGE
jgi:hypothetical protein